MNGAQQSPWAAKIFLFLFYPKKEKEINLGNLPIKITIESNLSINYDFSPQTASFYPL